MKIQKERRKNNIFILNINRKMHEKQTDKFIKYKKQKKTDFLNQKNSIFKKILPKLFKLDLLGPPS